LWPPIEACLCADAVWVVGELSTLCGDDVIELVDDLEMAVDGGFVDMEPKRFCRLQFGLVPRQSSCGGKERLGRITRQGDPYIRRLLVIGATLYCASVASRKLPRHNGQWACWSENQAKWRLSALANKMGRIVWALMTKETSFRTAMT
jgi:hypothetical protein